MAHEIIFDGAHRIVSDDAPNLMPGTFQVDANAGQSVPVTGDLWQVQQDATTFPVPPTFHPIQ
jgi:hypothetical protein